MGQLWRRPYSRPKFGQSSINFRPISIFVMLYSVAILAQAIFSQVSVTLFRHGPSFAYVCHVDGLQADADGANGQACVVCCGGHTRGRALRELLCGLQWLHCTFSQAFAFPRHSRRGGLRFRRRAVRLLGVVFLVSSRTTCCSSSGVRSFRFFGEFVVETRCQDLPDLLACLCMWVPPSPWIERAGSLHALVPSMVSS